MKKLIAFLIAGLGVFACAQADPDQYNMLNDPPVYGETNGIAYDRTNDYLSFFINDAEVGYIDSSGNVVMDGTITEGAQAVADDLYTTYGTGSDAIIGYEVTYQAPDSLVIGVGEDSRQLIIGQAADVIAGDMASAQQTNPTVKVCSANGTATECIAFTHDQTNAVIDALSGAIVLSDNTIVGTGGAGVDYTLTINGETNDCAMTCMEDENRLDVEGNLQFGTGGAGVDYTFTADGETNDGNLTWMEDEDYWIFNDDVVFNGAAGSLQFLDGDETVTIADNDSTAWSIDSSGTSSFVLADTTTDAEELNINGTTATSAFRVDTGFATFDEQAVLTAGSTAAAAYVCTATAADCITLSGAAPTMTIKDNEAAAFNLNSSGTSNFFLLDTTTDAEEVNINGTTAVSAFRVDTGLATFDEEIQCSSGMDADGDVLFGGGAGAITIDAASGSVLMSGAADNSAAGLDIGATGTTNMMRFVTTDSGEYVLTSTGFATEDADVTGADTMDATDCGKHIFVSAAVDGNSITLPALSAVPDGCVMTFHYTGADGGALVDISPNASDGIEGSCYTISAGASAVVEFNGTDDNDIGLTKATANKGDSIAIVSGDADDWYVQSCIGVWANN